MAFIAGQGIIDLGLGTKELRAGIGGVPRMVSDGLAKAARTTALAGAAIGAAVGTVIYKGIKAFEIQERAEAKLAATLRATGNAAGFTADQLYKQAAALQEVTTFGDETIINAMALLATFKNIRGEAFLRTTEAAMDLATVMAQADQTTVDLKGSMLMLAKAMNDPAIGLTYLNRAGVSFSETQKEHIKNLVASGKLHEAQRVILKEVEGQFGGLARAMSETVGGALQQLGNLWGDLKEDIGEIFLPVVRDLVDYVRNTVLPWLQKWVDWLKTLDASVIRQAATTAKWAAAVTVSLLVIPKVITMVGALVAAFKVLAGAQTLTLALSGPRGWAILAAGAAIAAVAAAKVSHEYGQLQDEIDEAAKKAKRAAGETQKGGKQAADAAAAAAAAAAAMGEATAGGTPGRKGGQFVALESMWKRMQTAIMGQASPQVKEQQKTNEALGKVARTAEEIKDLVKLAGQYAAPPPPGTAEGMRGMPVPKPARPPSTAEFGLAGALAPIMLARSIMMNWLQGGQPNLAARGQPAGSDDGKQLLRRLAESNEDIRDLLRRGDVPATVGI